MSSPQVLRCPLPRWTTSTVPTTSTPPAVRRSPTPGPRRGGTSSRSRRMPWGVAALSSPVRPIVAARVAGVGTCRGRPHCGPIQRRVGGGARPGHRPGRPVPERLTHREAPPSSARRSRPPQLSRSLSMPAAGCSPPTSRAPPTQRTCGRRSTVSWGDVTSAGRRRAACDVLAPLVPRSRERPVSPPPEARPSRPREARWWGGRDSRREHAAYVRHQPVHAREFL